MNLVISLTYLAAPYVFIWMIRHWVGRVFSDQRTNFRVRLKRAIAFGSVFFPLYFHVHPIVWVVMERHSLFSVGITLTLTILVIRACKKQARRETILENKGSQSPSESTDELDLRIAQLELQIARLKKGKLAE